jgi:hypothetical protein
VTARRRNFITDRTIQMVRNRTLQAMTASIMILRGDLGVLNPTTGKVSGLENSIEVYKGAARIRTINGGTSPDGVGGYVVIRNTIVSIPMPSAVPHADDLVLVIADDNADPDTDTRIFRVKEVEGGSLFGDARRMTCEGWHDSRYWGHQ